MFEGSKRQENGSSSSSTLAVHPGIGRQNSCHSAHMSPISGGYDGPGLRHRASFTSIDSSNSSILSKSPVSTITSHTMVSINGHSPPGTVHNDAMEDDSTDDTEKNAPITIEGHVLATVSIPVNSSNVNYRCGICTGALVSINVVYRCEGCSLYAHAGCLEELLYPCTPRGFDESGVCWSVLQMWAGLLKGYRSGIVTSVPQPSAQQLHQLQQLHYFQQSNVSRLHGHHNHKQPSNCGSEMEREGRDRLSWVSFQRWTGRGVNGSNGHTKSGVFLASSRASTNVEQIHQHHPHPLSQRTQISSQTVSRVRNGTDSNAQSDNVTFHREIFLKGVDKEAKVRRLVEFLVKSRRFLDKYLYSCSVTCLAFHVCVFGIAGICTVYSGSRGAFTW